MGQAIVGDPQAASRAPPGVRRAHPYEGLAAAAAFD
jgi:hypothetical protein